MTPILYTDYYKTEHYKMYPEGTTMIYSNLTPRKSRIPGVNSVVVFGIQHFVKKYLLGKFQKEFFDKKWEEIEEEYKYAIHTDTSHIKRLHELGYLPLKIKALKEGSRCPIQCPMLTIRNTLPEFYWLTNYLETLLSCQLWQPMTSATIAAEYWKILSFYAKQTTGSDAGVQWQGHDFSMRGLSSLESAILSGMGHLTSFTGTDSIPAIYALRNSYNATGLIGASVPATEHSVMCMGGKEEEINTLKRLLRMYPTGILSVVYDTWDLFGGIQKIAEDEECKQIIKSRDGKLVLRPDSGDPCDIICGKNTYFSGLRKGQFRLRQGESTKDISESEWKGVIELLWDIFGGTWVKGDDGKEYKVLNPCIGAIYGDSITMDRAEQICERLKAKGFASTNIVFGIGSYTYQFVTRDTCGFAVKATYGEVNEVGREIFKDPITDDGTKKSKKGLLCVVHTTTAYDGQQHGHTFTCLDQCTWEMEGKGALETVFEDGKLVREQTLEEIRQLIKSSIND